MEHECSEKIGDTVFLLLFLYFLLLNVQPCSDKKLTNVIIVQTIQTKQQHCQKYMKAMMK